MSTAELTRKSALLTNFNNITGRIAAAQGKVQAELMAVTKYAADEDVKLLVEAGAIKNAGENKVQDARNKWTNGALAALRSRVKLHFIGHLQTNKAKAAVETFDWIDSVDSLKLAAEIDRHARALGKTMPVLLQLKLNTSPTQSGVTPDQAAELLTGVRALKNLAPSGYMGIAPVNGNPEELKAAFAAGRKIFDRDFGYGVNSWGFNNYLSLGMSGDYEAAVAAGSNLPRIGSALFA